VSLLVIVPTRKRPGQVARFIESFDKTTDHADLLFVTDGDDDSYEGFDWKGHTAMAMTPRGCVSEKLNYAAQQMVDSYDQLFCVGDDNVFVTEHWDTKLLKVLKTDLGGSGLVYPNDKRRSDVPENWLVSTDVVREVGWFCNPILKQYYTDNSWSVLCKRADMIRYVPDVIVEHKHYSMDPDAVHDEVYMEPEQLFGEQDRINFGLWHGSSQFSALVSKLRRKFNPDVKWVLGKV
jgi:hypothetical protein